MSLFDAFEWLVNGHSRFIIHLSPSNSQIPNMDVSITRGRQEDTWISRIERYLLNGSFVSPENGKAFPMFNIDDP